MTRNTWRRGRKSRGEAAKDGKFDGGENEDRIQRKR